MKAHPFDPISLLLGIITVVVGFAADQLAARQPHQRPSGRVAPASQCWRSVWWRSRLPPADHFKMLTARATTSTTVPSDTIDCTIIAIFAQRASGNVSVGLNAAALVNDR